MAVRPPTQFRRPTLGDNPLAAALDQEILAEMAGTYGRLMRKLQAALAALRAFDADEGEAFSRARAEPSHAQVSPTGATPNTSSSPQPLSSPPRRRGPIGGGHASRANDSSGSEGHWIPASAGMTGEADRGVEDGDALRRDPRAELVRKAGEALWHVVIQRDVMRLSGTRRFLKELNVSAEVVLAMGVRRE